MYRNNNLQLFQNTTEYDPDIFIAVPFMGRINNKSKLALAKKSPDKFEAKYEAYKK